MRSPLWVIDTNVFVSAVITPGGDCDLLLQCAVSGLFIPAWDNKILREYREVLGRPKFRLSKASVRSLLAALPRSGFHSGVPLSLELPDPDDLPFLAVAIAGGDKTLVTGNPAHYPPTTMRQFGVTVLPPRKALDSLAR